MPNVLYQDHALVTVALVPFQICQRHIRRFFQFSVFWSRALQATDGNEIYIVGKEHEENGVERLTNFVYVYPFLNLFRHSN